MAACDGCGRQLTVADDVVLEQYGGVDAAGKFQPSEEASLRHADGCDDEDGDDG